MGLLIFELQGIFLFAFLGIMGIDLVFQIWDMWIERKARNRFGGLSSLEYTIHGVLILFHSAFLSFYVLYNFQTDRFLIATTSIAVLEDSFVTFIGVNLLPGAIIIALLHFILMHPYFSRDHEWERFFRFRVQVPGLD